MKHARGNTANFLALIVDDEADILELLELTLLHMGLEVERATTVKAALKLVQEKPFDLCLTDMRLPDGEGLELVRYIGANCPDLPVAVITAHGSTENAVAALKAGAFDYLSKPVSLEQLRALVKSALKLPSAPQPSAEQGYALLGQSPAMEQVRGLIDKLARSQAPVYITGESGSGKELAARLIHEKSARARQALRGGQLRRDSGKPDGKRVFRLPQGRFHRRRAGPGRLFSGGQRRHAVPRRSGRPAPADAGQAAARHPGKKGAQGGRHAGRPGGRAHHQRHPPESGAIVWKMANSARISTTAST